MSDSISHLDAARQFNGKASTEAKPYARPGSAPPRFASRQRVLPELAPAADAPHEVRIYAAVRSSGSTVSASPGTQEPSKPDLDLPWVTAFQDAGTATGLTTAEGTTAPLAEMNVSRSDAGATSWPASTNDGWLFQETTAELSAISSDPSAFSRTHVRSAGTKQPLPEWNDEDLAAIMSGAGRMPTVRPTPSELLSADGSSHRSHLQDAASALEGLARRVRSGAVHLPSHTLARGEAALLAAVLLSLLSEPA